jgi:hypothetical protein
LRDAIREVAKGPLRVCEQRDWLWRAEHVVSVAVCVELALMHGAEHTGGNLLGLGAARGAIPVTNLAGHDRRAQGVFRAPIRRVDVIGIEQEERPREIRRQDGTRSPRARRTRPG